MCQCNVIWKEIEDYPKFRISSSGQVQNIKKGTIRKLGYSGRDRQYRNVRFIKNKKSKWFSVHRLVAIHFIPNPENKPQVDHIDHNKSNNCICNLRWVDNQKNQLNSTIQENNTSGHKNICWHKVRNKWLLSIGINGGNKYLGLFDCLEIAIDFRNWYYEHILERVLVE